MVASVREPTGHCFMPSNRYPVRNEGSSLRPQRGCNPEEDWSRNMLKGETVDKNKVGPDAGLWPVRLEASQRNSAGLPQQPLEPGPVAADSRFRRNLLLHWSI